MRTDGDGARGPPVSRRALVAAVGAFAAPAAAGTGAASEGPDPTVRVGATDPYRPGLERAARARERDGDVRVVPAGSENGGDRLGTDLDALVSGRPTLPATDPSSDVGRSVVVTGWAALELPEDRWRECLRPGRVRDRWSGDAPVESWSESDWDSVAALAGAERGGATDPAPDPLVLVRGTRAYQYARGSGGLGHYRVEEGALDRDADVRSVRAGTAPLVRLGYVHADRSVPDEDLQSLLAAYDRRPDGDGVAYFPGANGSGATARSP